MLIGLLQGPEVLPAEQLHDVLVGRTLQLRGGLAPECVPAPSLRDAERPIGLLGLLGSESHGLAQPGADGVAVDRPLGVTRSREQVELSDALTAAVGGRAPNGLGCFEGTCGRVPDALLAGRAGEITSLPEERPSVDCTTGAHEDPDRRGPRNRAGS